jgi:hypothetical protein
LEKKINIKITDLIVKPIPLTIKAPITKFIMTKYKRALERSKDEPTFNNITSIITNQNSKNITREI